MESPVRNAAEAERASELTFAVTAAVFAVAVAILCFLSQSGAEE